MVVILIIFGIGFEVMLFVVIMDVKIYVKYLLVDYVLMLDVVIVDFQFVDMVLKGNIVVFGLDVLCYLIEFYVFSMVFDYIWLLFL